ncbi:MAG: hypothetical protein QOJ35_4138 [Solirubrobacteraceae bacterium]|nr:hypothetical protein [Solirubrobacteraceae bacterium]
MTKLVLTVIDGMKPTMLERAIGAGSAPALKAIRDRGTYVSDCVAAFPSVTPVCAGTIATGLLQDEHRIPSMNWYSRAEGRYVEYGSSFQASRKFGLNRQLVDTIFNMNEHHLSGDVQTVFEVLDDAGVRTACTSYLIFRGRHPHEVSQDFALTRVASQYFNKRSVMGPAELFYGDIFASRKTGCWSRMGIPGLRDQHAGCVGSYLVEHDLFDFLLLSLPDNDAHSHRYGPHAQIASIAAADAELWRVMEAGGGVERFLDEHAMIVMADHSHSHIERVIDFTGAFADWKVLQPSGANARSAEVALCPAQRSAMVYLLLDSRAGALEKIVATAQAIEGVDLVMWWGEGAARERRAHVAGERGELTFAPGDGVADARGERWDVDGELDALLATIEGDVFACEHYPDALRRVWSALSCETSGDVLLSAEPAYEFPDWGKRAHVRGGSHGSLHRVDSLGALLFCGVEPPPHVREGTWSLADIAPMVLAHFGAG